MRFKIIKNPAGQFRCQILGNNGEIRWWTENYNDKRDADKAIAAVHPRWVMLEIIGLVQSLSGDLDPVVIADVVSRLKDEPQKYDLPVEFVDEAEAVEGVQDAGDPIRQEDQ